MSNVAKRIDIVSIKMVKESSFLYQTRHHLHHLSDAYEMIKDQLEGFGSGAVHHCLSKHKE